MLVPRLVLPNRWGRNGWRACPSPPVMKSLAREGMFSALLLQPLMNGQRPKQLALSKKAGTGKPSQGDRWPRLRC